MTRNAKPVKLDTENARNQLPPKWHWLRLGTNRKLGYRVVTKGVPGTWAYRITVNGKPDQKTLGDLLDIPAGQRFDVAKEQAERVFRRYDLSGKDTGTSNAVAQTVTLEEVLETYIAKHRKEVEAEKRAQQVEAWEKAGAEAERTDRNTLKRFVHAYPPGAASWVHRPLASISTVYFQAWREWYDAQPNAGRGANKGKRRSKDAINRSMVAFHAALNLAAETYDLPKVWTKHMKQLKLSDAEKGRQKKERRGKRLDHAQRDLLMDILEARGGEYAALVPLVLAMCLSPIRPGALAVMRVENFSDSNLAKGIAASLHVNADKANPGRDVGIPEELAAVIRKRVKEAKFPKALLFPRADGQRVWDCEAWNKYIKKALRDAPEKLPAKLGLYWLRHTVLSELADAKHAPLKVADMAGTSVAMIEDNYYEGEKQAQADALAELAVGLRRRETVAA